MFLFNWIASPLRQAWNFYSGEDKSNYLAPNSLKVLPEELCLEVFSYLPLSDLSKGFRLSTEWKKMLEKHPALTKRAVFVSNKVFGPAQYEKSFGKEALSKDEIKQAFSALPLDIFEELKSTCPVSGKKMWERPPGWISQSVSGKTLHLKTLGELMKPYFPETENGYRYTWDGILNEIDQPIDKSSWMSMTDVLPDSRNKSYTEQAKMVEELAQKTFIKYAVPKTIEAAVYCFMEYLRSDKKIRLLRDDPWTYTRCQEVINDWNTVVGGFGAAGLFVNYIYTVHDYIAVAGLRKFEAIGT